MNNNVNPYIVSADSYGSAQDIITYNDIPKPAVQAPIPQNNYYQDTNTNANQMVYPPLYSPQQGYPPQGYPAQGYPAQGSSQQPIIIISQASNPTNICKLCKTTSNVIHRRRAGCAVWSWSVAICFLTGCCCWIPWVIDECHD